MAKAIQLVREEFDINFLIALLVKRGVTTGFYQLLNNEALQFSNCCQVNIQEINIEAALKDTFSETKKFSLILGES